MIFEDIFAFEENRAFFVRSELGFIILAPDVDRAADRTADAAPVRQPVGAGNEGPAIAFGAGIIFDAPRAPPVDHRLLSRPRARRRGVARDLERIGVVAAPPLVGAFYPPYVLRRPPP